MWKRPAALASTALALLAFCSSQALAGVQSDPAEQQGSIPPAAVLDSSFGGDGLVTLPGELLGWTAYGAPTPNGGVIVSGGPTLRLLTSSGDPAPSFGGTGMAGPPLPEGAEFRPSDLTVDPQGRLLVVGTSSFPKKEDEAPRSPNGAPLPIEPSAVRVLRFLPDGLPDPTFGQGGVIETDFGLPPPRDEQGLALQPEASIEATGIAVDSRGGTVVTGSAEVRLGPSCVFGMNEPTPVPTPFLARLTEDGALDPGFGGDGLVGGRTLNETPLRAKSIGEPVIGPSGAITYRSTALGPCPGGRWGVAQLTPDGRTRKTLGRKGAVGGYFTALAGEPDGSVIALARMGWTQGEAFRARLIRIGPDGEVDRSFGHRGRTVVKLGSVWGNEPDSLAVDAKGRILVGGTLVTGKRKQAPNGKLAKRDRHSILMVRLNADGRQEMSFGPNGRVATSFPSLVDFGPSDLFLDPEGRAVTVHRYGTGEDSGLVLARYLLRK